MVTGLLRLDPFAVGRARHSFRCVRARPNAEVLLAARRPERFILPTAPVDVQSNPKESFKRAGRSRVEKRRGPDEHHRLVFGGERTAAEMVECDRRAIGVSATSGSLGRQLAAIGSTALRGKHQAAIFPSRHKTDARRHRNASISPNTRISAPIDPASCMLEYPACLRAKGLC
jgi:hypothetical protein